MSVREGREKSNIVNHTQCVFVTSLPFGRSVEQMIDKFNWSTKALVTNVYISTESIMGAQNKHTHTQTIIGGEYSGIILIVVSTQAIACPYKYSQNG